MQLQNIKNYFAIIFIFIISLFGILILTTGIYYKFTKLRIGNNATLFLKKNLSIVLITILFTIFTVITSTGLNKIYIDCPEYNKDPEHPWFKNHISIQIIDILISFGNNCCCKILLTSIISNSIDYISKNNTYKNNIVFI